MSGRAFQRSKRCGLNNTSNHNDAELCVLDDEGYPRFDWIMRRRRDATLVAFDVLRVGRRDLVDLPLRERRVVLANIIPSDSVYLLRSRAIEDGIALFSECARCGLEGVIAKRNDSPYHPGVRVADAWLKIRTSHGNRIIRDRYHSDA